MKALRLGLHSFVLVVADLVGIGGGGMAAFYITGVPNAFPVQVPIAIVLSAISFLAWILLLRRLGFTRLRVIGANELGSCLLLSCLWAPLVFVPLHFVTQGYWTSIGNLAALALYQLPVNALALSAALILQKSGRAGPA